MAKSIKIVFKSGATIEAPYSSKFYADITANIGKEHVSEHPSATVQTKEIQAVVFENTALNAKPADAAE